MMKNALHHNKKTQAIVSKFVGLMARTVSDNKNSLNMIERFHIDIRDEIIILLGAIGVCELYK